MELVSLKEPSDYREVPVPALEKWVCFKNKVAVIRVRSGELAIFSCIYTTDIAFQAAQRVLSSSGQDALRLMRDISQNFPLMTRTLVKTQVNDKVRAEIKRNQKVGLWFMI